MSNQLIPYNDLRYSLIRNTAENNLVVQLYGSLIELRLEIRAYLTKIFYYLSEVAPILLGADLINIAFNVIDWLGLSESDQVEVKQWLLKIYSEL